jgi:hypothetical protein
MRRTTRYCAILALALAMFATLACGNYPPIDYCAQEPKPLAGCE